jgi:hypothetical protein
MKGYYIDIIDQELNNSLFVIEVASKSGVTLAWNGADKKDELIIVGSSLEFDIAHTENVDAKFIKFFTGNEVRFKVELRKYENDALIWTGHLNPDTYSEPYTNGVTFVKITGTCGLGRLKGKYLPESYYRDEKSVIDILSKSLSLTGLQMDLFFNPAIENSFEKNYKNIYIDSSSFIDGGKKKDVYSIVETLMNDMLSVCFQADGRWNIEGINQRSVRSYKAKLYDFEGNEKGVLEGQKLIKRITPLVEPYVTMVPPYNMITVTHPRVPQSFPDTIAKEKNEGWVVGTGVKGEIYATDWNGNNGYYVKAIVPDYYISLLKYYTPEFIPPTTTPFDEDDFVNLKNKIFVYKYQKLTIKAVFRLLKYSTGLTPSDANRNTNPFFYEFILNDTVLFSNKKTTIPDNENLIFTDDEAKLDFEVIIPEQGLIDVKLYRSGQDVYTSNIRGFEIRELAIAPVSFNEKLEFTDLINDEYTLDKDIELTYADDDTAFSNCFRLAKLKESTETFNTIEIPVIYGFSQSGNNYSVVDLDGANLIKDNINTTVYDGDVLESLEVIYNYNSSEQMVIKTDFPITSGSFFVKVYKNNDYLTSRDSWLQWTDSVYKIETNRYAKTVANIIRRMYSEPSEKLDVVALNAVKFNDLVLFHYVNDKQFVATNCSWNLDENKTTLTLSRAIYRDSGDSGENPENIPPIVNAGLDIELSNTQTTASLLATAYDTDGYIVSQQWTKLQGGFGDVIMTPTQLATDLQNLTEDLYEYKIQVTDNDGATANDSVRLIRRKDYVITLPFISKVAGLGLNRWISKWGFLSTPNIAPDFSVKIFGDYQLAVQGYAGEDHVSIFRIYKNGVKIFEDSLGPYEDIRFGNFSVGYISTDVIEFETEYQLMGTNPNLGWTWLRVSTITFVNGFGDFVGLPIKVGDLTDGGL